LAQLPPGAVAIDATMQRIAGIRVAPVEKGGTTRTLRVIGRIVPEDTRVFRVNSGLDGFIRETYNDSVGMLVRKDQKLASYYSPDILAVASGFLAASERVPGAVGNDGSRTIPFPGTVSKQGVSSMQGYTDRLRNLGMSDVQIKRMADSRQLPESIDIVAPADGFILTRNISPGQHFDHEMEFYRIADLSRVWVVAEVYERWLRFEELPKFINSLGNIERIDDTHFSFSNIRDGKEQRGVIEVMRQIPERRIAWRTIADGVGLGVVSFEPVSDTATEITLKLRSVFDPLISGQSAEEYLLNFKQLVENPLR